MSSDCFVVYTSAHMYIHAVFIPYSHYLQPQFAGDHATILTALVAISTMTKLSRCGHCWERELANTRSYFRRKSLDLDLH